MKCKHLVTSSLLAVLALMSLSLSSCSNCQSYLDDGDQYGYEECRDRQADNAIAIGSIFVALIDAAISGDDDDDHHHHHHHSNAYNKHGKEGRRSSHLVGSDD